MMSGSKDHFGPGPATSILLRVIKGLMIRPGLLANQEIVQASLNRAWSARLKVFGRARIRPGPVDTSSVQYIIFIVLHINILYIQNIS